MRRPPPRCPLFPYTTLFRSTRSWSITRSTRSSANRLPTTAAAASALFVSTGRRDRRRLTARSEEHTSELQSRRELVCRLQREKKKDPCAPRAAVQGNRRVHC